ncbi:MAG TPA: ribonuclease D [Verrucomicrobiae bacterium]|nr:ribonuclease D [Verrucomicrobiae bacterium]
MAPDYTLVETPAALDDLLGRLRDASWLAVDTEFVREDTYYAQLCLVQVSDGRTHACVDTLGLDPAPLFAFLFGNAIKVFHSAGQDLELFVQRGGDCPRPLFDTQVAAALLGHGEQLGYAALVERELGIVVDKSLSRTDWLRRPLSDAALAYAVDDVRHLAVIYPALRDALEQRGRLPWLEAECARLTDARRYQADPASAWRSIKGIGRLTPEAQHRAARLAAWREEEAIRRNRPRRWIIDDIAVCQLAARKPDTLAALAEIEGVSARRIEKSGEALLEVVRAPVAEAPPLVPDQRETPEQKQKTQMLLEMLRKRAAEEQVAPTLVATRSDIERLVREGPGATIALLSGWRRELLGEELLAKL